MHTTKLARITFSRGLFTARHHYEIIYIPTLGKTNYVQFNINFFNTVLPRRNTYKFLII